MRNEPFAPQDTSDSTTIPAHPLRRGLFTVVAAAGLVGGSAGVAAAAPGDTDSGPTNAHVEVLSSIALTGLTQDFTLQGLPGATVAGLNAVTMNVETNNAGGYNVTVQSQTPTLAADTATNPDSIPIEALGVREHDASDTAAYESLSDTAARTVHSQDTRSAQGGDTIDNDYQVSVPFVNEDTYTATLDYIATTQ